MFNLEPLHPSPLTPLRKPDHATFPCLTTQSCTNPHHPLSPHGCLLIHARPPGPPPPPGILPPAEPFHSATTPDLSYLPSFHRTSFHSTTTPPPPSQNTPSSMTPRFEADLLAAALAFRHGVEGGQVVLQLLPQRRIVGQALPQLLVLQLHTLDAHLLISQPPRQHLHPCHQSPQQPTPLPCKLLPDEQEKAMHHATCHKKQKNSPSSCKSAGGEKQKVYAARRHIGSLCLLESSPQVSKIQTAAQTRRRHHHARCCMQNADTARGSFTANISCAKVLLSQTPAQLFQVACCCMAAFVFCLEVHQDMQFVLIYVRVLQEELIAKSTHAQHMSHALACYNDSKTASGTADSSHMLQTCVTCGGTLS